MKLQLLNVYSGLQFGQYELTSGSVGDFFVLIQLSIILFLQNDVLARLFIQINLKFLQQKLCSLKSLMKISRLNLEKNVFENHHYLTIQLHVHVSIISTRRNMWLFIKNDFHPPKESHMQIEIGPVVQKKDDMKSITDNF